MTLNQQTLSSFETCGYGLSPSISAQAVVFLSPEPQDSELDFAFKPTTITLGNPKDVMTDDEISAVIWRTRVQVLEMQMSDYRRAISDEDKYTWKQRLFTSLLRCNEIAQTTNPALLQFDITPPTDSSVALSASGANWCYPLTKELTLLFMYA